MEWRRHLILIFKEGMNNILKHAHCKNVTLSFNYKNGILKINLMDNGSGFSENNHSNGKGLRNMQNRAESINGKLKIISTSGRGTTLKFTGEIPQTGH
jgi:signal transduction histidine kinase